MLLMHVIASVLMLDTQAGNNNNHITTVQRQARCIGTGACSEILLWVVQTVLLSVSPSLSMGHWSGGPLALVIVWVLMVRCSSVVLQTI